MKAPQAPNCGLPAIAFPSGVACAVVFLSKRPGVAKKKKGCCNSKNYLRKAIYQLPLSRIEDTPFQYKVQASTMVNKLVVKNKRKVQSCAKSLKKEGVLSCTNRFMAEGI